MSANVELGTLDYASPRADDRMPWRWVWNATMVWGIAMILEQAALSAIIVEVAGRRGWEIGPRACTDDFVPSAAAIAVVVGLLLRRRQRNDAPSRFVVAVCAIVTASALASIALWTLQVLPDVARGIGPRGEAYWWESELILERLLAVAWPALVVYFACGQTPSRRQTGAVLCWGALAVWLLASCGSLAIYHYEGFGGLMPRYWDNTILPVW